MEKFVNPKKVKRKRKHGFLAKSGTYAGQKTLKNRRKKGRKLLSI